MSEKKSLEQLQTEYQHLCTKAGHTQYQIYTLERELAVMNETLRDINFEAAGLKSQPAEQAVVEEQGVKASE